MTMEPKNSPVKKGNAPTNVLIVDDVASNRKLLRVVLEAEGFHVFEADNGIEALRVLERGKTNAIISDILMPQMDGYRFCYEVRSKPRFRHLPFIIYTATYTAPSDEKLALEVGADKLLTRPTASNVIVGALHEVIGAARAPLKPMETPKQLTVMKDYSERLVAKLEEKNVELAAKVEKLIQADHKLHFSETRYRRLFESAQDGILILDGESGEIIDINPFLLDLLGYSFAEMVGLKLWDFGQFSDIAANRAAFQKLQANDYVRYDNIPLRTKAGREIPVEFVSNVYLVDGEKIIQCNIRDISARAKVLEASQKQLTGLEIANRAKDEFLAALSHELRTPLAAIASMLDLLALDRNLSNSRTVPQSPLEFDESGLELIRRNVQILGRLINELLDLTQLSRGDLHLELQTVDAHGAIGDAIRNVEPQLKVKKLGLEVHLDAVRCHLEADPVKFQQILANLISNAIKFTPGGGKIRIATKNGSGDLVIEVADTGIGLPPDFASHIFAPFEQGDPSIRRRFGGLGLGLSISKSLTEAHRGTLQARSDGANQGATFSLRFKTTAPPLPIEASVVTEPTTRAEPMHILLVEDHADTRRCLCRLLESQGHQVDCAQDARSAIELEHRQHNFDLLITDVGLPDRTGLELLHELRECRPNLPAIAISGYGMPHDLLGSRKAGFLEHLVKPVDLGKLHALIETVATSRKRFRNANWPALVSPNHTEAARPAGLLKWR